MTAPEFGCRVLAHHLHPDPVLQAIGVAYSDLPTLVAESGIITLHWPLMPRTRHTFHNETLRPVIEAALIVLIMRRSETADAGK